MKKIILLLFLIFTLTSCNNNIIPKDYTKCKIYSDNSIEQIGHTIQFSIYTYDQMPNLKKNRFLKSVTNDDLIELYILLNDFNNRLTEYDQTQDSHEFKNNFNIKLSDITSDDYVYIDNRTHQQDNRCFMIYYFETSNNTLYYLQMIYKTVL